MTDLPEDRKAFAFHLSGALAIASDLAQTNAFIERAEEGSGLEVLLRPRGFGFVKSDAPFHPHKELDADGFDDLQASRDDVKAEAEGLRCYFNDRIAEYEGNPIMADYVALARWWSHILGELEELIDADLPAICSGCAAPSCDGDCPEVQESEEEADD